ncbi:MAG TPA: DUF11 domain-containing protein [Balneolaceae bacterium]|nr:DUF11 domain-containing protein [Balneolaceae bacterium]
MTTTITHILRNKALRFVGLMLVVGMFVGVLSNDAHAQSTPPANTTIGNQATATYTDNGGNARTVTSNTVETVVQQVAGITISAGLTKTASPGGEVSFPHNITNNGNGTDSFSLTAAEAATTTFSYGTIVIYPDADGNGVPDSFTAITSTPTINAGDSYGVVIVAQIPSAATDGQTEDITVTATSVFDGTTSDTATSSTIVEEGAVINVQKTASSSTANAGDTVTYTFTFSNTGNANGTNLLITDPIPAGMTYVPGSGVWSGSGTGLDDNTGNGDDPTGVTYEFDNSGAQGSVIATIASLNSGNSGTLQFDVTVDAGTEGQTITNVATYDHDDLTNPASTNGAAVTVNQNFSISTVGGQTTVTEPAVSQGATVNFLNTFVNNSNVTDRFNITLSNSDYPSGTTFTLLQTDGSGNPTNPYSDTNNDGIPDTGPVAGGATIEVILQVSLPSNASGGGPFTVDKTLTSINDAAQSATLTDELLDITAESVDITNVAAAGTTGALGEGQGPEGASVQTKSTDPGTVVTFDLYVTNTGSQTDNYGLAFGTQVTGSSLDNPGTAPAGWSIQFRDPANGNSIVTQTGSILPAGGNKLITAEVTVPAGAAPVTAQSLYFRALSSSTSSSDIVHNAVTVNSLRVVSLASNNTGQIFPGGSRTYTHTFTVNSNVVENNGVNSDFSVALANSANGFISQVYWDVNGDGVIDSGDELITSAGATTAADLPAGIGDLQFGDVVNFIVKVTASTGVNDGTTNTTTLTVSDTVGPLADQVNDDITTVVAGLLTIEKFQAPDNAGSAGTFVKTQFNVLPNDIVYYRITVTNDGSQPVTNIVISDNIPSFTTQLGSLSVDDSGIAATASVTSVPGDGNTGAIQVSVPNLLAGETFDIEFAVRVDS